MLTTYAVVTVVVNVFFDVFGSLSKVVVETFCKVVVGFCIVMLVVTASVVVVVATD